jgi:hypothetical protein
LEGSASCRGSGSSSSTFDSHESSDSDSGGCGNNIERQRC